MSRPRKINRWFHQCSAYRHQDKTLQPQRGYVPVVPNEGRSADGIHVANCSAIRWINQVMSELSSVDGRKAGWLLSNIGRHGYQQVLTRNEQWTLTGLGRKGPRCQ